MFEDLVGKVAVIAGGAGGLGSEQARVLDRLGATVVVADLDEDRCRDVANGMSDRTSVQAVDVRSEGEWSALVTEVTSRHGGLDILVNTFGIAPQGELASLTLADYMTTLSVNQVGVFLGMRSVIPAMLERGGGAMVNVSSGAGVSPMPRLFAYSATKAAVITMTKAAAMELGHSNIRVNCVLPGTYDTALRAQTVESWRDGGAGQLENAFEHIPIPRMGRPEELANLVAFLSSDASSFCTGGVFLAEGGALAGRMR
jgi:3alpha(or 20beta)-hydroxysteroid dehydrogenase